MTISEEKLLPCPFCGSSNIDAAGWATSSGNHGPACDDCGASAGSATETIEQNIAAWNRRSPSPELMAAREALKPDSDGWTYSINYGPDGQQDWANLTTPEGRHVSNIRAHDAIRICAALNAADTLPKAIDAAEQAYIGAFWMLGKGRVSAVEKLYGFQMLFGTEEIIASGEGDTPQDAIRAALELRDKTRG